MKRIFAIVLALLVCLSASAQLNVKKTTSAPEKIAESFESKAILIYQEQYGYLMSIISSNRYDKGGYFKLGYELTEAIQTLTDIIDLCDTIGDQQVTVEPWPNRTCIISSGTKPGWLYLKFSNHAGHCDIKKANMIEFRNALEERKLAQPDTPKQDTEVAPE